MNILDEIFAHKKIEVAARKRVVSLADLRIESERCAPPLDFTAALRTSHMVRGTPALIAEVKFASPSKGVLVAEPDPLRLAHTYAENGAASISVLTDEKYFRGHLETLRQIHAALPDMPLLRKDFVCDPYQVYEARTAGASAVLLIAAYLDPVELADLHTLALSLDLSPLVEVHDRQELDTILKLNDLKLLGVNNRDLRTFKVDLQTCLDLRPLVPPQVCFVAESGAHTREDVACLAEADVDAILVGEALVTAPDVGEKIQSLFGGPGFQTPAAREESAGRSLD